SCFAMRSRPVQASSICRARRAVAPRAVSHAMRYITYTLSHPAGRWPAAASAGAGVGWLAGVAVSAGRGNGRGRNGRVNPQLRACGRKARLRGLGRDETRSGVAAHTVTLLLPLPLGEG